MAAACENGVIEFRDACKNAALHPGSGTRSHLFLALPDPDKNHQRDLLLPSHPTNSDTMTFQTQTCIEGVLLATRTIEFDHNKTSTQLGLGDKHRRGLTITLLRTVRSRRRRGRLLPQRRRRGRYWRLSWRGSRRRTDGGRRAPVVGGGRRLRARLGALLGERVAEGAVGDEAVAPAMPCMP